ncbi:MAG: phosphate/phosphite/phosphonate ABC transporter substrate-binding protein [Desulfobulbaceae bacterium]
MAGHIALVLFCLLALALPKSTAAQQRETLLLGIEPEHNIFDQVERYRVLAEYLSDQLGIRVDLTIMSRYGEVIKRFRDRQLDGAFLSPYTAALGIRQLGLLPVASPVNLNGEAASRGYIFVRADSGIQSAADMRGKNMVFVDPATMEGYLYPRTYLHEQGVKSLDTFFSRYSFAGSHASVIFAVLDGRADIGAAKDTVYDKMVGQDPSMGQELRIIARSPKEPEVTLCLTKELRAELREKISEILLHMETTSRGKRVLKQFEALRFIESNPADFATIEEMAEEAGIPLDARDADG